MWRADHAHRHLADKAPGGSPATNRAAARNQEAGYRVTYSYRMLVVAVVNAGGARGPGGNGRTVAPRVINIYGDKFPTYHGVMIGLVFMGVDRSGGWVQREMISPRL